MELTIIKNVNLIINYINNIRRKNNAKSYINKIEFDFRDKYCTYETDKFKQLLDDYCEKNNITYEMYIPMPRLAHFIMKFN